MEEKEKLKAEYFGVGDLEVSNNDKFLAYSLDTKGSEYYTIFVREIEKNKDLLREQKSLHVLQQTFLLNLVKN